MDPQRPIYPQRVRKKGIGLIWCIWRISPKLSLVTIKNGSAMSDLPPEGQKKKSWADLMHWTHLTHLAHFADLADLAKISDQKCKKSVLGEAPPT